MFNAESDDELMRRFTENRRILISVDVDMGFDVAAVALALIVLV